MEKLTTQYLPLVAAEDIKECAEKGECCQCGACCTVYTIAGIPRLGKTGPGSVSRVGKTIQKTTKRFGERCWHLVSSPEGKSFCALHDTTYKPEVCQEWQGHLPEYPHLADGPKYIDELRSQLIIILIFQGPNTRAQVNGILSLLRNGTLKALLDNKTMPWSFSLAEQFVEKWIIKFGILDENLFAITKLPIALASLSPQELNSLLQMLDPQKEIHRAFREKYIDPLLSEENK